VAGVIIYFGDAANPTVENGMIHAISSTIDAFIAAQQEGVWIRNIAIAMGHPRPPTP
jgi:hypothetical protein